MQVKICGITNVDDALTAAECGADFVGLILAESPRAVAPPIARQVIERLSGGTEAVLLFRDQPLPHIVETVGRLGAGYVQLHGAEPPEFIGSLCEALPNVEIIRAWALDAASSVDALFAHVESLKRRGVPLYRVIVDLPKRGANPSDEVFRNAADRWKDDMPGLWRAGGVTPATVVAALSTGRYVGVDVARGVESAPGRKDPDLVRRFIRAAKLRQAR